MALQFQQHSHSILRVFNHTVIPTLLYPLNDYVGCSCRVVGAEYSIDMGVHIRS